MTPPSVQSNSIWAFVPPISECCFWQVDALYPGLLGKDKWAFARAYCEMQCNPYTGRDGEEMHFRFSKKTRPKAPFCSLEWLDNMLQM